MFYDHKLRQKVYHLLESPNDVIKNDQIIFDDKNIIHHAVSYFYNEQPDIIYPAKSLAVAIIYSILLKQYFNIPFLTSLNDPNLLMKNDRFFVPYNRANVYYSTIIEKISKPTIILNNNLSQIDKTINYFKQEFYLVPNKFFDFCIA